jgi:hypothetical protein
MANSETEPVLMTAPAPLKFVAQVGSASGSLAVGQFHSIGTGTASAFVIGAAPAIGDMIGFEHAGTATAGKTVVTDAAGTKIGTTNRTLSLQPGSSFVLIGVSTTRWAILSGGLSDGGTIGA